MAGLDNLQKSIQKKLKLQNYKTDIQQEVNTAIPQYLNTVKKQKITVYLTENTMRKLNEMCSKNILQTGKQDKSALLSRALDLLYEKEGNKND